MKTAGGLDEATGIELFEKRVNAPDDTIFPKVNKELARQFSTEVRTFRVDSTLTWNATNIVPEYQYFTAQVNLNTNPQFVTLLAQLQGRQIKKIAAQVVARQGAGTVAMRGVGDFGLNTGQLETILNDVDVFGKIYDLTDLSVFANIILDRSFVVVAADTTIFQLYVTLKIEYY
jgi:hypothetical protein